MLLHRKTIGFTMQKHRYSFHVRIFRNIKNLSQSGKDRKGHAEKRIKGILAKPLRPWRFGERTLFIIVSIEQEVLSS